MAVDVMTELLIEEFDDEQIWQELELFNRQREKEVAKGLEIDGELTHMGVEGEEEEEEDNVDDDMEFGASAVQDGKRIKNHFKDLEDDDDDDDDDDESDDDDYDSNIKDDAGVESSLKKKSSKSVKTSKESNPSNSSLKQNKSVVDDSFFRLDDLSKFLDAEDAREERKRDGKEEEEDDAIDLFGEIGKHHVQNDTYLLY